jgi:hypothetical protein
LLGKYFLVLVAIIAVCNVISYYLYKPSIQWIKALQPYKTPELTSLMRFISNMGEGHYYGWAYLLLLSYGSIFEANYFVMVFFVNVFVNHLLKTSQHQPRPYFDDPSVADPDLHDCSGEFGNPSAHAILFI